MNLKTSCSEIECREIGCVFPDCLGAEGRKQYEECETCRLTDDLKPSHDGSKRCESGSIASGGNKSHCTCDICF